MFSLELQTSVYKYIFSGRDAAPMFLRRGKLPKNVEALKQPGKVTDRTVLNVFGPTGHGGRYILDSLKVKMFPLSFLFVC